jgi:hypothetical protein
MNYKARACGVSSGVSPAPPPTRPRPLRSLAENKINGRAKPGKGLVRCNRTAKGFSATKWAIHPLGSPDWYDGKTVIANRRAELRREE